MTKRLLLTAFEPFNGETRNPSLEALQGVDSLQFPGVELDTLVLPVARFAAIELILERLRQTGPEVVVMFGEAGGRARITPERVAINVDDYRIPDDSGVQPHDEPVIAGGPVGYFSTLPIRAMLEHLTAAGIPAGVSNTAGTYLCNRVFYYVMHTIARENLATRAGFIHLPYLHEQAAGKTQDVASISRQTVARAAQIVIETVL